VKGILTLPLSKKKMILFPLLLRQAKEIMESEREGSL
jgi:hypothetical protein